MKISSDSCMEGDIHLMCSLYDWECDVNTIQSGLPSPQTCCRVYHNCITSAAVVALNYETRLTCVSPAPCLVQPLRTKNFQSLIPPGIFFFSFLLSRVCIFSPSPHGLFPPQIPPEEERHAH